LTQTLINTFAKTNAANILVLFLARDMGRKMISQMTFFDFIVGVTIGTMMANVALGTYNESLTAIMSLVTLTLLTVVTGRLGIKSFKFRKLVNSEPVVVIANGKIISKNMNKIRLTISDLMMQLREKNIFNISNVEFAIMEKNGKLSILPKSQQKPLTPADLELDTSYSGLTRDIIIDGQVMTENLADANLDTKWLEDQLRQQDINDITEVFYAGLDTAGNLYISLKDGAKSAELEGKYGIE
jgi:uncharacterized membrane protein YcaP (DUF421 family)